MISAATLYYSLSLNPLSFTQPTPCAECRDGGCITSSIITMLCDPLAIWAGEVGTSA